MVPRRFLLSLPLVENCELWLLLELLGRREERTRSSEVGRLEGRLVEGLLLVDALRWVRMLMMEGRGLGLLVDKGRVPSGEVGLLLMLRMMLYAVRTRRASPPPSSFHPSLPVLRGLLLD
jgi:hypothetical protein